MEKGNPIIDSLVEIAKIELAEDLIQSYNQKSKELGKAFDQNIADICGVIVSCQMNCKPGTTFICAGLLLMMPDEDEDIPKEEWSNFIKGMRAAIYWGLLRGLNELPMPNYPIGCVPITGEETIIKR